MELMDPSDASESGDSVWVFGYGSLCWHPGFEFEKSTTGYIKGYSRKFWQGNDQHRGTQDNPGRVATLIQEPESIVWGRAFHVRGPSALPYLNTREGILGGYMTSFEHFYPKAHSDKCPRGDKCTSEERSDSGEGSETLSLRDVVCEGSEKLSLCDVGCEGSAIKTMMFVACPSNSLWLGEAPLHEIANQIVSCQGPSGHNAEYVLRLAIFMRENIPDAHLYDPELFTLEIMIRSRLKEQQIPLHVIMNEAPPTDHSSTPSSSYQDDLDVRPAPRSTDFAARLPNKNLRCVNIN